MTMTILPPAAPAPAIGVCRDCGEPIEVLCDCDACLDQNTRCKACREGGAP